MAAKTTASAGLTGAKVKPEKRTTGGITKAMAVHAKAKRLANDTAVAEKKGKKKLLSSKASIVTPATALASAPVTAPIKRKRVQPSTSAADVDAAALETRTPEKKQRRATATASTVAPPASEMRLAPDAASPLADDDRADDSLALANFRLAPATLEALRAKGVSALFPIQAATFDLIYDGCDLIGRARTGMGKTLAFSLPIVGRILELHRTDPSLRAPRRPPIALVMAPTRELAQQVAIELASVARGIETLCVYGGSPMGPQCNSLRAGIDVLVGTPGAPPHP